MKSVGAVEKQIISNGKRIGFVIRYDNKSWNLSLSKIDEYIDKGIDLGITKNKRGYQLTNGGRISDLPIIYNGVSAKSSNKLNSTCVESDLPKLDNHKKYSEISYYTGNELKNFIDDQVDPNWKRRDVVADILNYMNNPEAGRLLMISGIRETGKTVSILQSLNIATMDNFNDCIYIVPNEKSEFTPDSICEYIMHLIKDKKYVVIDEATRIKNFIDSSSILAEKIRFQGKRLIISGTDSLVLAKSKWESLFHRVIDINITFITYKEVVRMLNYNMVDYIKMGRLVKDEDISDFSKFTNYVNTAVVNNVLNTVERNKHYFNGKNIIGMSDQKIGYLIYRAIFAVSYNHVFDNKDKVSGLSFGRIVNIFKQDMASHSKDDNEGVMNSVCSQMGILDGFVKIEKNDIHDIVEILLELGILIKIQNIYNGNYKYYFVNPVIINQAYSAVYDALKSRYSASKDYKINGLYGDIFESVIIAHLYYYAKRNGLGIGYFHNEQGREIDCIVYKEVFNWDKSYTVYYEIKMSPDKDTASIKSRWLNDTDYRPNEEPIPSDKSRILKRCIIYNGKTQVFTGFDDKENLYSSVKGKSVDDIEKMNIGTLMISASDLLLNMDKYLGELVNYIG